MNEVKKRVGRETWICYKSDTWSCTGDFDWGSPLAEQKVWNKGITTYLIFKAREGEAYFISWAIGIWLISMLESVQYFSRHQKTCWAESSVPSSGRHVASVLHKQVFTSPVLHTANCSLWLPWIKSWIIGVARLLCSQWLSMENVREVLSGNLSSGHIWEILTQASVG